MSSVRIVERELDWEGLLLEVDRNGKNDPRRYPAAVIIEDGKIIRIITESEE